VRKGDREVGEHQSKEVVVMNSEDSAPDPDIGGESPLVGRLMDWSAELVCGFVGSMLGSDSDHLLLGAVVGAVIGTALGAMLHFNPRVDLFLSKSTASPDS
jgi:hypothetical protein